MTCRQFRNHHVAFVDDLLPAVDMRAMREHLRDCDRCASLDVRIRRSLMVVRSLPSIQPSPDFMARLEARLRESEPPVFDDADPSARWSPSRGLRAGVAAAAVALLVLAIGAAAVDHQRPPTIEPAIAVGNGTVLPLADAAIVAAMPTGVPVWSAVFATGHLPVHFATAELGGVGR